MLGSCLLLLAWSATALVLPDAAYATRGRRSRAGVRLSVPDETKEKILDALKYNKALTELKKFKIRDSTSSDDYDIRS